MESHIMQYNMKRKRSSRHNEDLCGSFLINVLDLDKILRNTRSKAHVAQKLTCLRELLDIPEVITVSDSESGSEGGHGGGEAVNGQKDRKERMKEIFGTSGSSSSSFSSDAEERRKAETKEEIKRKIEENFLNTLAASRRRSKTKADVKTEAVSEEETRGEYCKHCKCHRTTKRPKKRVRRRMTHPREQNSSSEEIELKSKSRVLKRTVSDIQERPTDGALIDSDSDRKVENNMATDLTVETAAAVLSEGLVEAKEDENTIELKIDESVEQIQILLGSPKDGDELLNTNLADFDFEDCEIALEYREETEVEPETPQEPEIQKKSPSRAGSTSETEEELPLEGDLCNIPPLAIQEVTVETSEAMTSCPDTTEDEATSPKTLKQYFERIQSEFEENSDDPDDSTFVIDETPLPIPSQPLISSTFPPAQYTQARISLATTTKTLYETIAYPELRIKGIDIHRPKTKPVTNPIICEADFFYHKSDDQKTIMTQASTATSAYINHIHWTVNYPLHFVTRTNSHKYLCTLKDLQKRKCSEPRVDFSKQPITMRPPKSQLEQLLSAGPTGPPDFVKAQRVSVPYARQYLDSRLQQQQQHPQQHHQRHRDWYGPQVAMQKAPRSYRSRYNPAPSNAYYDPYSGFRTQRRVDPSFITIPIHSPLYKIQIPPLKIPVSQLVTSTTSATPSCSYHPPPQQQPQQHYQKPQQGSSSYGYPTPNGGYLPPPQPPQNVSRPTPVHQAPPSMYSSLWWHNQGNWPN